MDKCQMLDSFRVLDLSDETGQLCGKILGDFGADVIKIEKPGGDRSRNIGPFYKDSPHSEKSLFWFFYNANKRGVTLDIESLEGKDIFKKLLQRSDFVIETFKPGHLDSLGLGYSALKEINPRIILVSITPFGQDGPYKDYIADDLIVMSIGGSLYINGEPQREPVSYCYPLSWGHAGSEGAATAMIAHYHRQSTGTGQHVDVSIQQCIAQTLHNVIQIADLQKKAQTRTGIYYRMKAEATGGSQAIWKCKDGYVCYIVFGGRLGGRTNRPLTEWMDGEGMAPQFMKEVKWEELDMAVPPKELLDEVGKYLAEFFSKHTKKEIYDGAIKHRVFLCPVNDPSDIVADPQLESRNYWEVLEHPELKAEIRYPGAFAKMSETPMSLYRRAPLIGEHNMEVYGDELGMSREDLILLMEAGVI